MLLGTGGSDQRSVPVRLLAATWHVAAVLYFLGAWSVSTVRLLLDMPSAFG